MDRLDFVSMNRSYRTLRQSPIVSERWHELAQHYAAHGWHWQMGYCQSQAERCARWQGQTSPEPPPIPANPLEPIRKRQLLLQAGSPKILGALIGHKPQRLPKLFKRR